MDLNFILNLNRHYAKIKEKKVGTYRLIIPTQTYLHKNENKKRLNRLKKQTKKQLQNFTSSDHFILMSSNCEEQRECNPLECNPFREIKEKHDEQSSHTQK